MERPRVLVHQPLFTPGANLDYRMLGFQFWIADQLSRIGFEGASGLMRGPARGDRLEMTAVLPPTDAELRHTLLSSEARYGVVAHFEMTDHPTLTMVRLVEARRGHPLRNLQRWNFGGADHLPTAALEVVRDVAKRLGIELAPTTWETLFDTQDPAGANNYFTALGVYFACDQGFIVEGPEPALQAIVICIGLQMGCARALLPDMVEALVDSGSTDVATVRAAVEAALEVVVEIPAEWGAMLAGLRLNGVRTLH